MKENIVYSNLHLSHFGDRFGKCNYATYQLPGFNAIIARSRQVMLKVVVGAMRAHPTVSWKPQND